MTRVYTEDMLAFLRKQFPKHRIPELTDLFNAEFNENKKPSQIRAAVKNHKIRAGRKGGYPKGTLLGYSTEQLHFLTRHYPKRTTKELTEMFNRKFVETRSVVAISSFLKARGISSGRTGRFEKGSIPWNTGTKGLSKRNCGSYQKGNVPANVKPLWHERVCSKDGVILMKVPEANPYTGTSTRYIHKHVWIWRQAHGAVPKGHVITFVNGNPLDCYLENLMCITRAVFLYLNRHGYRNIPDDLKPALLTTAKLVTKASELGRQVKQDVT